MVSENERLDIGKAYYKYGFRDGQEKGEAKGKMETAKNLIRLGVDIDTISKATGLTEEEVSALHSA